MALPKFSYIVKDKKGKTHKSIVDSASEEALISQLQKQDYFIVSLSLVSYTAPKKKKSPKKARKQFRYKRIKLQDLLVFSRQLATMLDAGVPPLVISRVLRHASFETTRRHYAAGNVQKDAGLLRELLIAQC